MYRSLTSSLLRSLLLLLALNLPFWVLGQVQFVNRALVNLEYIFPLMLALVAPWWAAVLLVALWGVDWAVANAAIFHFHSPPEFIYSARYLGALRLTDYLSGRAVLLATPFVFALWALWRWGPKARRRPGLHVAWHAALIGALALLVVGVDALNGSSGAHQQATMRVARNLAGSPSRNLYLAWRNEGIGGDLAMLPAEQRALPSAALAAWMAAHPDRSVVLVLAESLGLALDEHIRDALARALQIHTDISYRLESRAIEFAGSTTHGELRELCGISGSYLKLDETWAGKCAPHTWKQMGWESFGLHGFSKSMFMRDAWWPRIGIDHSLFAEDLQETGESTCGGTFAGLCDQRMVQWAFDLATVPKRVVYLLSLNAHLPLAEQPVMPTTAELCQRTARPAADCLLQDQHLRLLQAIGEQAAKASKPPLVIIVGDHAPPFAAPELRALYSPTQVPALLLWPKH